MNRPIELFYIFFQGIAIFQAIIFAVIFFLTSKKDTLYYALFLLAISAYFFINAAFTFFGIPEEQVWGSQWYSYINTPVIITANILYLLFHQAFFADLTHNPVVKKAFRVALILMILLVVMFSFLSQTFIGNQVIYYSAKTVTIIPAIIVVYYLLNEKPPFYKWIVTGLLSVIAGTALTAWMDYRFSEGLGSSIFETTYPFFFVKLGLLGEMICYLIARLKKWIYQEKELAVEKIESQLAVEKLRNKISGELHDDIGSTLSGIAMYSHMADDLLQKNEFGKLKDSIGIIHRSSNEVVQKLGDLVWAINPEKDSMESMLEKIRQYGFEMCNAKNILFEYNSYEGTGINHFTMDKRQHIFLFLKEAINNAVKHSNAKNISFQIVFEKQQLIFSVNDNGTGFISESTYEGNGLKSMQHRAEAAEGVLSITSLPGKGTNIGLVIQAVVS